MTGFIDMGPRITLRQLATFTAIAELGNVTQAAARIALSQSAASQALQELERALGTRLFDRSGKRLALNDNGRAFYPRPVRCWRRVPSWRACSNQRRCN